MKYEDILEARRLYEQENKTIREIGEHFGVTRETVRLNLMSHGCPLRNRGLEKGSKYASLDLDKVFQLYYAEKKSITEIAKRTGVTAATIKNRFTELNIPIRRNNPISSHLPEEKILSMYNAGFGCHLIAKKIGVSAPTIHHFLVDKNVDMRPKGRVRSWDLDLKTLKKMYRSGMSTHEISRELGIGQGSVYKVLKEAGVKMRSPGRRCKK